MHNRLQATGAGYLQAHIEVPLQPDVLNYLMLAVMLLNQVRSPFAPQGRTLAQLPPKIDRTGAELLAEIQRMSFQFLNFDEHRNLRRPQPVPRRPRKCAQRRKSRRELCLG